jgi:Ni/Fe-hydrogenase subunit HybB-like protein
VGGTSWLYLASVPFEKLGFVTVGTSPPPRLTEAIQHSVFRYFVPPVSLYALLGGVMKLSKEEDNNPGADRPSAAAPTPGTGKGAPACGDRGQKSGNNPGGGGHGNPAGCKKEGHHSDTAPVARKLMSPGTWVLVALMAVAGIVAFFRFTRGIGAVTNLNNQYPWGIWIGIDVATGVALAAGGFTTAALVHIFHRERYEAIVRPALLTAMLGYTFVWVGLMFDLGKYYNVWHPMMPEMWSGHSVLFEVGMCVLFYLTTLYLEFMPIVCERFVGRVNLPNLLSRLNGPVDRLLRFAQRTLDRLMFAFIIAGVVLSCLHQSSLGSLMLIAPYKTHPLWWTPILPLLFLLSAIAVGFPMVIVESMSASRSFGIKPEMQVLSPLSRIIPIILGIYLGFKIGDSAIRGTYRYLFDGSTESIMFLVEMIGGVILPMVLLFSRKVRTSPTWLFISALLVVLGVALNRVNVFIIAYTPPYADKPYVPAFGEFAITIGLIAALIFCYRLIVTRFPVIAGHASEVEAA